MKAGALCRLWEDAADGSGSRFATVGILDHVEGEVAHIDVVAGGRNTTGRRRWARLTGPLADVEFPPWGRVA